jgi:hypothetical protein
MKLWRLIQRGKDPEGIDEIQCVVAADTSNDALKYIEDNLIIKPNILILLGDDMCKSTSPFIVINPWFGSAVNFSIHKPLYKDEQGNWYRK